MKRSREEMQQRINDLVEALFTGPRGERVKHLLQLDVTGKPICCIIEPQAKEIIQQYLND